MANFIISEEKNLMAYNDLKLIKICSISAVIREKLKTTTTTQKPETSTTTSKQATLHSWAYQKSKFCHILIIQ